MLGNTDEMLWDTSARPALEASAPKLKPLFKVLFDLSGPATTQMIGASRLAWLRALPTDLRFENLRHENLALMHASPGNLWRAPMDTADDAELENTYKQAERRRLSSTATFTGRLFARSEHMTVCNTGSVGSPYDGDPRASYLMIDDGKPATRRVAYDVEKEIGQTAGVRLSLQRVDRGDAPQGKLRAAAGKEWLTQKTIKYQGKPPHQCAVIVSDELYKVPLYACTVILCVPDVRAIGGVVIETTFFAVYLATPSIQTFIY